MIFLKTNIVLFDNSYGNSYSILLSNEYPNVKIIFLEGNSGSAAKGRNTGIDNATTDYIMFLDQDDKYDENTILLSQIKSSYYVLLFRLVL